MSVKPWIEAASLMILSRSQKSIKKILKPTKFPQVHERTAKTSDQISSEFDYRLMMLQRSENSSVMASAFVFPGGAVELSDFSPRWWQVFESIGKKREQIESEMNSRVNGPRPPIIADSLTLKNAPVLPNNEQYLPANIGLRISALRETFEEAGVLLLNDGNVSFNQPKQAFDDTTKHELDEWRHKIVHDGNLFVDLCLELKKSPDIWRIYEWWNWFTPPPLRLKRFDAFFYVCFLDFEPTVYLDDKEVTDLKWGTPFELLEAHSDRRIYLAPPQTYELARLSNIASFDSLRDFAIEREKYGVEQWLPVIHKCQDGMVSCLPGDDEYVSLEDAASRKHFHTSDMTTQECREKINNLNRIENLSLSSHCLSNQMWFCGHLPPVNWRPPRQLI